MAKLLLDIATGTSAKCKRWKNEKMSWEQLVKRLSRAVITPERYKDFVRAPREEQLKIKDVGGFVGGHLINGKRSPSTVAHRQLLTLDIDFAHADLWQEVLFTLEGAAVLHGTHKHSIETPRYRLIVPLDRPVHRDEYEAIARQVAGWFGIELFDRTTFEVNRLMFWPSVSQDVDYYFRVRDGEPLSADSVLESYTDWTNSSQWPTADRERDEVRDRAKAQADPTGKEGIVGAFCRTYSVEEAIETFLGEHYAATDLPNRYTYTKGTTAAGLITYDGKFAYSHHGTDPTSGMLCNAFDLVRVHLFGHLDDEGKTGAAAPSFKEMEKLALSDAATRRTVVNERLSSASFDFADEVAEGAVSAEEVQVTLEEVDPDWKDKVQLDKNNAWLSSSHNLNLILRNDENLRGIFALNLFDSKRYLVRSAPWRSISSPVPVGDVDYSGLRNYIDCIYSISSAGKIDDAAALVFQRNSFHPVRQFLEGLAWDGVPRIDRLAPDYLGAEDNIYTREALRKHLVAGVARIYEPGIKYDMMVVLVGKQGKGKSTFIRKLAMDRWFSDSFTTVQGKEAFEQLQGAWMVEAAELSAFKKSEVESVKHFVSKQSDRYRPAYGRTVETFFRQCIFWGTSNPADFLKDSTGNRRFNPIDTHFERAPKDVIYSDEFDKEVPQIWAEAVALYRAGEKLYLSQEANEIARHEQELHSEMDDRLGLIRAYLDADLPAEWEGMSPSERALWVAELGQADPIQRRGTVRRRYVCTAEIWVECLGRRKDDMNARNTRELNDLMRRIEGWEARKTTKIIKPYGAQRYYERVESSSSLLD